MTLSETLTDYVNAAFSGIYLVTHEADEAEREIAQLARQKEWRLAAWDVSGGLRFPIAAHSAPLEIGAGDPLAVLRALPALAENKGTSLLLLHNFHKFLNNPVPLPETLAAI